CTHRSCVCVFFFNDTATTEIYTLSLHDALPISGWRSVWRGGLGGGVWVQRRSEEHTSELQSHLNLVCRLLLEKKKQQHTHYSISRARADVVGDVRCGVLC